MDIKAINDLLSIVTNASEFKKSLEQLKAEQEKLMKLIEVYGKLTEADRKIRAAEDRELIAERMVTEAEAKAESVKDGAAKYAASVQVKIDAELTKAKTATEKLDLALAGVMKEVETNRTEKKLIAEQKAQLAKDVADVEAKQKMLNDKLGKLQAVLS